MQFEKTVPLRGGAPCLLRAALPEEAAETLACFLRTHGETDYLLSYPEESGRSEEKQRAFLKAMLAAPRGAELCAWVDGHLAGMAGFSCVGERIKTRHRAEFGISVEKAYWGRGIGRALTQACIALARAAGYRQLELDVVAENAAAIALYESCGFAEYGRNPRGFCRRDGSWQPLVLMRLEFD